MAAAAVASSNGITVTSCMLALAADDERDAGAIALAARQDARGGAALALLQQLDLALLHLAAAARFDGAHVGVVDPGEASILAAQPHRDGQRIEQGAAGAHFACEPLVLREDAGDLVAVPGDVAEAQHGAAAGRASFRLEMAARHRMHDDVERLAGGEQGIERGLENGGGVRLQPLPEAQEPLRAAREGPGMPRSVWATTRMGWFCSQNSRICGSERMIESAAARLRLRPLTSATARRSSRLARTTVSQNKAPASSTMPPMNAAMAKGCEPEQRQRHDPARGDRRRRRPARRQGSPQRAPSAHVIFQPLVHWGADRIGIRAD